jgi:hypothetical protein
MAEESEQNETEPLAFEIDDQGRFVARLPCGKRPLIKPIHPSKFQRIVEAFPRPDPPKKVVEVPGSGMGQKVTSRTDPEFLERYQKWYEQMQVAFLVRCVTDGLVVPEEADYDGADGKQRIAMPDCKEHHELGKPERWKRMGFTAEQLSAVELSDECTCKVCEEDWGFTLRAMSVPIPQTGPDRIWAYVEEALPEVLQDMENQSAFILAVRSISVPTEAAIRRARRNFRHALARLAAAGSEVAAG